LQMTRSHKRVDEIFGRKTPPLIKQDVRFRRYNSTGSDGSNVVIVEEKPLSYKATKSEGANNIGQLRIG